MIYSIGLSDSLNIKKIEDTNHLNLEDIIIIDVISSLREKWNKATFKPEFELTNIEPDSFQTKIINDFIERGGTVITSITDPKVPIETPVYEEEIKNMNQNNYVKKQKEQDLIILEYFPYDWLNFTYRKYLNKALNIIFTKHHKKESSFRLIQTETIGYKIENEGCLIFTTALEKNVSENMLQQLIDFVEKSKRG